MNAKAASLLLAGLLSGCALMRNDLPAHAQIPVEKVRLADDIRLARQDWPQAQWWRRYADPQLNALVERALKGSPTIAMARARMEQAGSQVELLNAGSDLQVTALAMMNRQYTSANGFMGPYAADAPVLGLTGPWYTEGTLGAFAGLNVDLWARERSQVEAAVGAQNARVAEQYVVELELSAEVAQLYFSIQTNHQLLELMKRSEAILQYAVQAHQGKAGTGLEARVPLHGARAQLLSVQREMAQINGQIRQTRETLRALLGAGPDDLPDIRPMPLPQLAVGLPDDIPYQLLSRRPDLQAMRWYVQSSFSEIDAARAAFYPSFSIKAFFGLDSIHLASLFKGDSKQMNLIPGFYLPLFDGGRLNANLHNVRAGSNMMIEQYNQAVLNAVRDIAVSGSRLQSLDEERRLQLEKIEAARYGQLSVEAMNRHGLSSRLAASEAGLPVIAEQTSLLLLDAQRLSQNVVLIKALGGGYDARQVAMAR